MRRVAALLAGAVTWVFGSILVFGIVVYLWHVNPDSRIGMAFVAYFSSAIGAYGAWAVMHRIDTTLSKKIAFTTLGIFAFVWIGIAVAFAPNNTEFSFRLTSLIMSLLGIGMAIAIER